MLLVAGLAAACTSSSSSQTAAPTAGQATSIGPVASPSPTPSVDPMVGATTPAPTAPPQAMSRNAAEAAVPSNLQHQTVPSVFISKLPVGASGFTDVNESETPGEPTMTLLRAPNGSLCLSWATKVWKNPGGYVDDQNLVQINALVTRTSPDTFIVAVAPNFRSTIEPVTSPVATCRNNPKLQISTSASARTALGCPDDLRIRQVRYVPGQSVWIATKSSHSGYLLAESSREAPFSHSVAITRNAAGQLVVSGDPASMNVVGADQIAEVNQHQDLASALIRTS
jgi:hypothetical protein